MKSVTRNGRDKDLAPAARKWGAKVAEVFKAEPERWRQQHVAATRASAGGAAFGTAGRLGDEARLERRFINPALAQDDAPELSLERRTEFAATTDEHTAHVRIATGSRSGKELRALAANPAVSADTLARLVIRADGHAEFSRYDGKARKEIIAAAMANPAWDGAEHDRLKESAFKGSTPLSAEKRRADAAWTTSPAEFARIVGKGTGTRPERLGLLENPAVRPQDIRALMVCGDPQVEGAARKHPLSGYTPEVALAEKRRAAAERQRKSREARRLAAEAEATPEAVAV